MVTDHQLVVVVGGMVGWCPGVLVSVLQPKSHPGVAKVTKLVEIGVLCLSV